MSHAPQAAIDERPVTAARSARGRADRPSAERYAPVVRIAVLRAVVFGARKLRALEDENVKLKKLLGEAMLDNAILKDVAAKNV